MRALHWKKLGLVYVPNGDVEWARTHASNPVAENIGGDLFRVYFSPRDSKNRSQIASVDMILSENDFSVIVGSMRLVLAHGKLGRFDDCGVTVTGFNRIGGRRMLFYLGWNLCKTIPFRNSIGVAVSEGEDEGFARMSEAPIVDRSSIDPISLSYPFVFWDDDHYKIWYGTCMEWGGDSVEDYHFSLKYAESLDGVNWNRDGKVTLASDFPMEDAIARPCVIKENGVYKMWYSYKKGPFYRMGYAVSSNGLEWVRKDKLVGLHVSESGWDSEMIEYPFVFDHGGRRYMLYNGNGYGKTGFGLAVLERD